MKWIEWNRRIGRQSLAMLVVCLIPLAGMSQEQSLADMLQKARDAGIEQSQLDNLENRAASRNFSDDELARVLSPAVSLAEQNLPSEMIFQKAMEGLAKGVPASRMNPVLQNIRQNTETIVPVVDSWMERGEVNEMLVRSGEGFDRQILRNEMVKSGSKAASGPGGPELVSDILNSLADSGVIPNSRPSSLLAGVSIISNLPDVAERPEAARGVVIRAIQGGFSASDIQKLPGAVNVAQRRSQMPARAVLEGVSQQLQGNIPASQILQNLFDGNIGGGPPGGTPPGLENRPDRAGPPR